jgi:hypothetical protein
MFNYTATEAQFLLPTSPCCVHIQADFDSPLFFLSFSVLKSGFNLHHLYHALIFDWLRTKTQSREYVIRCVEQGWSWVVGGEGVLSPHYFSHSTRVVGLFVSMGVRGKPRMYCSLLAYCTAHFGLSNFGHQMPPHLPTRSAL